MSQAYRGKKTNYDKWDDISSAFDEKQHLQVLEFLVAAKYIQKTL